LPSHQAENAIAPYSFIGTIYRERKKSPYERSRRTSPLRQSSVSPAGHDCGAEGQSYMPPAPPCDIPARLKLSQASSQDRGVSRTTVRLWKNGHVPIPRRRVELIKRLFACSIGKKTIFAASRGSTRTVPLTATRFSSSRRSSPSLSATSVCLLGGWLALTSNEGRALTSLTYGKDFPQEH